MFIEKIEIPAFRVLRDVVLDFSGGYEPQIFPIGSENGGGKSTLLQLIFVLLHCSTDAGRHPFLKNLLESDARNTLGSEHLIARVTVRDARSSHELEFVSLGKRWIDEQTGGTIKAGFGALEVGKYLRAERLEAKAQYERIGAAIPGVMRGSSLRMDSQTVKAVQRVFPGTKIQNSHDVEKALKERMESLSAKANTLEQGLAVVESDIERIDFLFAALDYKYITNYVWATPSDAEARAVVCRSNGITLTGLEELLAEIASKVFLLGPSNQQYLFLGVDTRKALLGKSSSDVVSRPQLKYLEDLSASEKAMEGFFAYDWLSIEPLLKLFALARDEDFKNVVKTGQYGNSYTVMLRELNGLLLGKKVRPLDDLSGIEFIVVDSAGRETALSPEDLSQGELKRLMIYAWLRANHAVDAVVLIDEIEASFHPDWQVGIVRDLQDWAPNNQYLLATHSYELCQALTPRHVRELQPRLRKVGTGDEETKPGPTE